MPLARRLTRRYRHTDEPRDDLEQVAYLALIKAIDHYDPKFGPLARYAVPSVLGELKRHFRDKGWGVHVSRSLQERSLRISAATDHLSGQLGRSPTVKDIARHTDYSVEEVAEALEATNAYAPAALDAPRSRDPDGDRTLGEGLGSNDGGYEMVELNHVIAPAVKALPAREQTILRLRFLEDLTQSEIAARLEISQMHVSRLLRRSLDRIQVAAGER
ncbi:N/A [soil metagenome]